MSIKQRLFAKATLPEEIIEVEGEKFLIRGLTARGRQDWVAPRHTKKGGIEGLNDGETSANMEAELIILCTFDPETGEPVFEKADRDAITQLPGAIVAKFREAAQRLSGLLPDDEEPVKND